MSLEEKYSLAAMINWHVAKVDFELREKLICEAITRATGTNNPNPYDFINRMSLQISGKLNIIFLDGSPIIQFGESSSAFEDGSVKTSFPYSFLIPKQKGTPENENPRTEISPQP